jgi:plasmid stabilization system protein ParE
MKYQFHPEAEAELNASIDYYQEQRVGLGIEFAQEIYDTIQRIMAFPKAWQVLDGEIRRCLTHRFPYGVIYYQQEDTIVILAVMQMQKEPGYWKQRIFGVGN